MPELRTVDWVNNAALLITNYKFDVWAKGPLIPLVGETRSLYTCHKLARNVNPKPCRLRHITLMSAVEVHGPALKPRNLLLFYHPMMLQLVTAQAHLREREEK